MALLGNLEIPMNNYEALRGRFINYESLKGEYIDEGHSRIVYEHAQDDSLVIKQARKYYYACCNEDEYYVWQHAYPKLKEYLAPIIHMSRDGKYLMMKRTKTTHELDSLRELEKTGTKAHIFYKTCVDDSNTDLANEIAQMPSCVQDASAYNIGFYEGRLVFHDYEGGSEHIRRLRSKS